MRLLFKRYSPLIVGFGVYILLVTAGPAVVKFGWGSMVASQFAWRVGLPIRLVTLAIWVVCDGVYRIYRMVNGQPPPDYFK